jgi:hypothetical protein
MRKVVVGMVAALAAISFGAGTSVLAAPADNVSFFHGEDGSAHWGPNQSHILLSETTTLGAYAGAVLMHVGATAPLTAPSFNDVDSINENGGGSPRLVIAFADGGTIVGYRLQMEVTMQTSDLQWDSMQGTAGFLYGKSYTVALADHNGSPVVAAYLVTDSGWEGSAYTNTITNVTYDGNTYAS